MGVYSRFKKQPQGLRALVELLETTPVSRRGRMIEVGMEEDPDYTERALQFMLTFDDILGLPDLELAEVTAAAPGRIIAMAIYPLGDEVKQRFLRNSKPPVASEVKTFLEGPEATLREIGGAQLKLVEITRQLEKRGYIRTKQIPA